MDKQSLPNIEKFAAFLDGKLSPEEMQQFLQLSKHNDALHQLITASSVINESVSSINEQELKLPDEILNSDFKLPDIDNIDFFSSDNDSYFDVDNLNKVEDVNIDDSLEYESMFTNNSEIMNNKLENGYRSIGDPGENHYDPIRIQQPDDHSCALRSQQIVLRDFGIDIPFEDLEVLAKDAGVYSDDGTYTYDIGKVLEIAGVQMHQVPGSSIYDLTNELAQGHRVIVSVDANELWYNNSISGKLSNWFDDVFGRQGGNHALIVAGVEINPLNSDDVKVVLTDPGAGHLRIEYPLNQFMDAWKDSNCFMAATNEAAPYQYDLDLDMEVPSNFAVEHQYNQFVIDHGYQLKPDMINVPESYQPAFTGHLDMIGDVPFEDYFPQHEFENEDYGFMSPDTFDDPLKETTGGVGIGLLGDGGESTGGVGSGDSGEGSGGVGSGSDDTLPSEDLTNGSFNHGW